MKTCKHCHRLLPLDQFYLVRPDKEWRQGRCVDCFKIKNSVYNTATAEHRHARDKDNLPKILAWRKADRAANPEKYRTAEAKKRQEKHDELLAYQRDYQASHRDEFHEYGKKSYAKNREKTLARQKARIQEHPEIAKTYCAKRRARKNGVPFAYTPADESFCRAYFHQACAACGNEEGFQWTIAMDHWIPISSPLCPGTVARNMIPLCHGVGGCNNTKHTKMPEPWLIERFGPRRAKKILAKIHAYFALVSPVERAS